MKLTLAMSFKRMKPFWVTVFVFGLVFVVLFSIRLDLFNNFFYEPANMSFSSTESPPERDSWMNIMQNCRKIGVSHTTFLKRKNGYILKETLYMRINCSFLRPERLVDPEAFAIAFIVKHHP